MMLVEIIWREASLSGISSCGDNSARTSTDSPNAVRGTAPDFPVLETFERAEGRGRQRPEYLCLIGVRADGTQQCLLGGLLSFDQARRARIIMRDSDGYLEYESIRIVRDDRMRDISPSTARHQPRRCAGGRSIAHQFD